MNYGEPMNQPNQPPQDSSLQDVPFPPGPVQYHQPGSNYPNYSPQYGYLAPPQQARSGAQYVRNQKGHSLFLHLALGWMLMYLPTAYYAVSPNHYFHL